MAEAFIGGGPDSCVWCGKTYAEHRDVDVPRYRMPCNLTKSGFATRKVKANDYDLVIDGVKIEWTPLLKYPKRFRDMAFRESDVHVYWSRFEDFEARAKRLLPLWRKWGLRDLYLRGRAQGGRLF